MTALLSRTVLVACFSKSRTEKHKTKKIQSASDVKLKLERKNISDFQLILDGLSNEALVELCVARDPNLHSTFLK